MLQDSATGAFYFPDKKLKNTTLGQVERHGDQTSFNPFLKFEDIHPFSLYMAQEGLLACLAKLTCMSADNVCLKKTAGINSASVGVCRRRTLAPRPNSNTHWQGT